VFAHRLSRWVCWRDRPTDWQTDGRQTVTLRFPLDAANVESDEVNLHITWCLRHYLSDCGSWRVCVQHRGGKGVFTPRSTAVLWADNGHWSSINWVCHPPEHRCRRPSTTSRLWDRPSSVSSQGQGRWERATCALQHGQRTYHTRNYIIIIII